MGAPTSMRQLKLKIHIFVTEQHFGWDSFSLSTSFRLSMAQNKETLLSNIIHKPMHERAVLSLEK